MTKLDEQRSEAQFGRSLGSPYSRCRDVTPRILAWEEITHPIRRKHATEPLQSRGLGYPDHEYNETTLPFRQRTNSANSFDTTIRIRPTPTTLKVHTDVVIAWKSTPRIPTSSSSKQGSKQKLSFHPITAQPGTTSSLSVSAKPSRKKKYKKSGGGPVPKPLPTIFDVGRSSLFSELVTLLTSTTTPSDFSLDDTFLSWNMDTLSSIPSPPDRSITPIPTASPSPNPNLSSLLPSASSEAPFSTPYDEDALLMNEIPFPLNKHSGVIIENMGVKKAKKISNKGKESLLNRRITTVEPDLHPYSNPKPPLALRSLNRNTNDRNQKGTGVPSVPLRLPQTPTPRIPASSLSSSTKDAWGCVHLGPSDYDLSIAFPQTSHYEVWDMDDEAFFACPLFLCLMAKDPRVWVGTPISLPDVSLIDIRCDDLPVPNTMSVYDPSIEYSVQCTVPQTKFWSCAPPPPYSSSPPNSRYPFTVDTEEITIEGRWERTYNKPKKEGEAQIFRIADRMRSEGEMNGRGWYLKIWIPVPARLFLKRETRIFEIRASVWMMGEERLLDMVDSEQQQQGKVEEDLPLIAEAEMTVSHLRREREMMTW